MVVLNLNLQVHCTVHYNVVFKRRKEGNLLVLILVTFGKKSDLIT